MFPHFFSSSRQEPRPRQGSWAFWSGCAAETAGRGIVALVCEHPLLLVFAALALTACSPGSVISSAGPETPAVPTAPSDLPSAEPEIDSGGAPQVEPALINPRVTDFEAPLPPRLLGLDAIRPVYDPVFATAAEAPLEDDELVIGIELEGEAKAYPITVLRFREMVNDELAGWPILVTW